MFSGSFEACGNIIPVSYVQQAQNARKSRENQIRIFLEHVSSVKGCDVFLKMKLPDQAIVYSTAGCHLVTRKQSLLLQDIICSIDHGIDCDKMLKDNAFRSCWLTEGSENIVFHDYLSKKFVKVGEERGRIQADQQEKASGLETFVHDPYFSYDKLNHTHILIGSYL